MKEDIIENYDKAHEIFILAFENYNIDTETHKSIPNKPLKRTKEKTSALDIEQAFINLFDKTYNEVKYKTYPDKKDLLSKGKFNTIIYAINENIILTHKDIKFIGKNGSLVNNNYSFLIIQNRDMTLFNPTNKTMIKIKDNGRRVPFKEIPIFEWSEQNKVKQKAMLKTSKNQTKRRIRVKNTLKH